MELDKLFRDSLRPHEETPSNDVWAKLSQRLDAQEDKTIMIPIIQKPTWTVSWRVYGVAASVLFMVATSYWFVGGQAGKNNIAKKTTKTEKNTANSVERLAYDTDKQSEQPIQDTTSQKQTPKKPIDNKQSNPKHTNPKNTKPKIFRPAPTRTELIATVYEVKIKEIAIETEPIYEKFITATVSLTSQPEVWTGKPKKERKHLFKNLFAGKDKELKPKRKFKILGFDASKAFATRE